MTYRNNKFWKQSNTDIREMMHETNPFKINIALHDMYTYINNT